jgi:hypothetical protein
VDVDEKRAAFEQLADRIVARVMYEPPDDLDKIEAKLDEARENYRVRERQIRFRSAYAAAK